MFLRLVANNALKVDQRNITAMFYRCCSFCELFLFQYVSRCFFSNEQHRRVLRYAAIPAHSLLSSAFGTLISWPPVNRTQQTKGETEVFILRVLLRLAFTPRQFICRYTETLGIGQHFTATCLWPLHCTGYNYGFRRFSCKLNSVTRCCLFTRVGCLLF